MSTVSSTKSKGKRITKPKSKTTCAVDPTSTSNVGQVTEDEYIVEKIVTKELKEDGTPLYWIKWKGWASIHNTWEPEENLTGCPELLEKFKKAEKSSKGCKSFESRCVTNKGKAQAALEEFNMEERMRKTKAQIIDYGVQEVWPKNLIPIRIVGVVNINQTLTYIVRVQSEEDGETDDKENVQSEEKNAGKDIDADKERQDDLNCSNVVVIYSHGFKRLFPQIVIDYYQKQVLWVTPYENTEAVAKKAADAFNQKTLCENGKTLNSSVSTLGAENGATEEGSIVSPYDGNRKDDYETKSNTSMPETEVLDSTCNAESEMMEVDADDMTSEDEENQHKITIRKDEDLFGLPEDLDSSSGNSSDGDQYEPVNEF